MDQDEKAYGIIPYRKIDDRVEVVMVKQARGGWGFPKGHQEWGETPQQTALRECREETSLIPTLSLVPTSILTERYTYTKEDKTYHKLVTYWLGEIIDGEPKPDGKEIVAVAWVPLKDVAEYTSYPSRKVLMKDIQAVCAALGLM